ncbi:MAG: CoB--CoM heterodisulfide reductase iron-sulfur subunit A family protein, partial [Spartobacteria bacterium]|nr:CoB--CoM heterodisulfide reductase iron-sulfur subunit A family protein [Spartobacteria bacterium]
MVMRMSNPGAVMCDESYKGILFLCKCGANIANFVDVDAIAAWANERDDIQAVQIHDLFCSPAGKAAFKQAVADNKPDSIIMAACSPKMHEKTFQGLAEECGVNMASVQMANIREQCGWVTADKEEATAKAMALINAAIKRSALREDLEKRSMDVLTDVLVIGGGMAGIEAALMAAKAGRKVYIVEKEISLGGQVIKTEEVAPNMECAPCLLAPRLSAISEEPNITVISNAEILDILGFYGNFNVRVLKKARYVEESCIGCEACFDECPVSVKSDFMLGMGTHKAVYTLFPGSVPAAAVIDKDACLHFVDGSCNACVAACPFESINFEQQDEVIELAVGAVVVATGFDTGDMSAFKELGHGVLDNVYTTSEFERIASSNGPYGSAIQLKNGAPPASIAVIHCAGSLREDGIPYCSGICCMNATKVGALAHHQLSDVKVYNIHKDLVYTSPAAQAFLKKEQQAGTQYIPCDDLTSVSVSDADGALKVTGPG